MGQINLYLAEGDLVDLTGSAPDRNSGSFTGTLGAATEEPPPPPPDGEYGGYPFPVEDGDKGTGVTLGPGAATVVGDISPLAVKRPWNYAYEVRGGVTPINVLTSEQPNSLYTSPGYPDQVPNDYISRGWSLNGAPITNSQAGGLAPAGYKIQRRDVVSIPGEDPVVVLWEPYTVVAPRPPAPFTGAMVALSSTTSPGGNELRCRILSWPEPGNSRMSHAEYALNPSGPWLRLDRYDEVGYRPLITAPGYTGSVWIRAVNRDGAHSALYEILSVPAPQVGDPTVVVTALRIEGTAPFGTILKAEAYGFGSLRPYRDLGYIWDTDDDGTFTRLVKPGRAHTDLSRSWSTGPIMANNWTPTAYTGGVATRTPTCTVYSRAGHVAVGQLTLTIHDPDEVYAGSLTSIVSATGATDGAPVGATPFTTLEAAIQANIDKANARILMNRGEYFATNAARLNVVERGMFGAYGPSSTPPRLETGGVLRISGASKEIQFQGIDCYGLYRADDAYNYPDESTGGIYIGSDKGAHASIDDMLLGGGGTLLDGDETFEGGRWVVTNVHGENWGNYGTQRGNSGGHLAYFGVNMLQRARAINGASKVSSNPDNVLAKHGPYRCSRSKGDHLFSRCWHHSNQSWGGSDNNYPVQPCARLDHQGTFKNGLIMLSQCQFDGGGIGLAYGKEHVENGGADVIFDGLLLIDFTHIAYVIGADRGGMIVRNSIFVHTANPPLSSTGARQLIQTVAKKGWPADAGTIDPIFENISYLDLRLANVAAQKSTALVTPGPSSWPGIVIRNNAHVAPNFAGFASDTGLNGGAAIQSLFEGKAMKGEPFDPSYAPPPFTLPVPIAGSSVIDGASYDEAPVLDFFGRRRRAMVEARSGTSPSRGAIEYDGA